MFIDDRVINLLICEGSMAIGMLVMTILFCLGVELFNLKKLDSFFTFKKITGLFLIFYTTRFFIMCYFPLMYPHN
jgi:hypothetical protein